MSVRVPAARELLAARVEFERLSAELVFWQEELDWECLRLYGVVDEVLTVPEGSEPVPLALGERAFEIVMARRMAAGELETAWFVRHRSTPITELPAHWPDWYRALVERRIELIETDRNVGLIERPEHKRRWASEPWEAMEERALREWLLDRLEDRRLWFEGSGESERAVCRSVAQLADRIQQVDPEWLGVARLWKGQVELDPAAVVAELVADEHVPAQSGARYKPAGLVKRRQWERTWELQRLEDEGQALPDGLAKIPVPPKYASGDFLQASFWRQRGKLDVPKERFVSVHSAERDVDRSMVLAWAGFDHVELAQALGTLLVEREQEGWDGARRWPVTVALVEQLFWLDLWHAETDPRYGASPAQIYRGLADHHATAAGRATSGWVEWKIAAPVRGRRRRAAAGDEA